MKKKRIIILSILTLLIISVSVFLVFNKNILNKLRGDVIDPAYKRAGFESEEIYQCVIDEYNKMPDHGDDVSIDTVLTDNQMSSMYNFYDWRELFPWYIHYTTRATFVCNLKEDAKNKEINLKGIEKINSMNSIVITGQAKKITANNLSINTDVHYLAEVENITLKNSNIEYLHIGTPSTHISSLEISNNNISEIVLNGSFDNVNIDNNIITISDSLITSYYSSVNITNATIKNNNNLRYNYFVKLFYVGDNCNISIDNLTLENEIFSHFIRKSYNGNGRESLNLKTINISHLNAPSNNHLYLNLSNNQLISATISDSAALEEINLSNNQLTSINLSGLPMLDRLISSNNQLTELNLSNFPSLKSLQSNNCNLSSIDLSNNTNLDSLDLSNNKLTNVDLSNNKKLKLLFLSNNELTNIDLSNNTNLLQVNLSKNKLTSIDLSDITGEIILSQDSFYNNLKYVLVGEKYNISNLIKGTSLNYSVNDFHLKIKDYILQGVVEGISSFNISSDRLSSINFSVNVYDVKSEEYNVDKEKKEIEYTKTFDKDKVYVTEGFTVNIEDDNFIISNGEDYVDTFKLVKKENTTTSKTTTKKNDSNSSNIISNAIDGIKSFITGNKSNSKNKTEKRVLYKNINLTNNIIEQSYLKKIKGYNKNIVLKNNDLTFKVNGLDNIDIIKDINLNYKIVNIKDYSDEVKSKIDKGYVLEFNNKEKLSYKVLTEIPYSKIKEEIKEKDIKIYLYKDNKYYLVSNNLIVSNGKISFYIDELGVYVLTNNRIDDSTIKKHKEITKDNEKLVYRKKNNNLSRILTISIIVSIISTILIICGIILVLKLIKRLKHNC